MRAQSPAPQGLTAFDASLATLANLVGDIADVVTTPRLSILIFHRVLPRPDPLYPGEMWSERFDRLMAMVRQAFSVVTLGQALALRETGGLPRRALAITFDDGYADNSEVACPILQRHGLKATFFIATGFLDGGRMFNDTVVECLRATCVERLDLNEWGLGVFFLDGTAARRRAIDALLPKVKYLGLEERNTVLGRLMRLAGEPALPNDLMMTSEQVIQLHRAGMEIGGHTMHHPILRLLPDAEAEAEVAGGRRCLQELIGAAVEVFAYPNGKPLQDYDERHVALVRRLGFRGAVCTAAGVATGQADVHQLPRFTPWDRSDAKWISRLVLSRMKGHQPASFLRTNEGHGPPPDAADQPNG